MTPQARHDHAWRATPGPDRHGEVGTATGAVGKDLARIIRDHGTAGAAVIDVGRRHRDLLDQRRTCIGTDMRLEAADGGLPLVLHPTAFVVILAGRGDDGGLHQRAGLDRDRLLSELRGDNLEQLGVEPVRHQQSPGAHEGRPPRRRLMPGKAAEPAERGTVIKRFSQLHVRQVMPHRQQQRLDHRKRGPGSFTLRRRVERIKEEHRY